MIKENELKRVIYQWIGAETPSMINREVSIPLDTRPIVSITGGRRVGKTYLMCQTIKQLEENIDKNNILYVDFEDERLRNMDASDLNNLFKTYYRHQNTRL